MLPALVVNASSTIKPSAEELNTQLPDKLIGQGKSWKTPGDARKGPLVHALELSNGVQPAHSANASRAMNRDGAYAERAVGPFFTMTTLHRQAAGLPAI
jgi:hypothetical protein